MYEGRNKTALKSQANIAASLLKLTQEKPLDDLSINEIAKDAKTSRQTFYTLFETKRNAMAYAVRENHAVSFVEKTPDPSIEDICQLFTDFVVNNRELLARLFRDNMESAVFDLLRTALSDCSAIVPDQQQHRADLITSYIAGGLTATTRRFTVDQPTASAGLIERTCAFLLSQNAFSNMQRL